MMAELKPCPFCGFGIPLLYTYDPFDGYQGNCTRYKIVCGNCSAEIRRPTEADVIEAWNKRAENEELEFTRKFIHEHGLDFALTSAWKEREDDG